MSKKFLIGLLIVLAAVVIVYLISVSAVSAPQDGSAAIGWSSLVNSIRQLFKTENDGDGGAGSELAEFCCPEGYSEWGDFCCNDQTESQAQYPPLIGRKYCKAKREACQVPPNSWCNSTIRPQCCPEGTVCGVVDPGPSYPDVSYCVPDVPPPPPGGSWSRTNPPPGYYWCTRLNISGHDVYCKSGEETCTDSGGGVYACQPTPQTCTARGQSACTGRGEFSRIVVCCGQGTGCARHQNGYPFCADGYFPTEKGVCPNPQQE